jgi:succinoglycan biosynthesis protein ExoA
LYRVGARAGPVDTVPFGAFRRSLLMRVNGFDETLLTNEDYELNARIRREGGVIWLDPEIRSKYFARATLAQLASQYWRYGYWKFRMLRRYPSTLRWRQALPPIFVGGLLGTALCALLWSPALIVLGIELALYVAALVAAGIDIGVQGRAPGLIPGSMLALMTMHFGWGSGFLWSLVSGRNEPHG